jgi:hypothetical protein
MCGRGGGRYMISRRASTCGGRLRGHELSYTLIPRAKRGAGLFSAPPRATECRSSISLASEIDDGLCERPPAMGAQMIDLMERGRAGTPVKRSLDNRDRFAAQAAPVGSGTCLEFPMKFVRKILDQ